MERPTAITVMAILNAVFGAMGLLTVGCCGGLGVLMLYAMAAVPVAPGEPNPSEIFTSLDRHAPTFKYYLLAVGASTLVESFLLIGSCWGLLKMRYWGRTLALWYGVICILGGIAGLVYVFVVLNPAMQEWEKDVAKVFAEDKDAAAAAGGPKQLVAIDGASSNPLVDAAFNVIMTLFAVSLAIANIIVMMLPSVRAALAVANGHATVRGLAPEDPPV